MVNAMIVARNAVIYTRVSTGEQAEHGTSLAAQLATCTRKAEEIGAAVVANYEDAGVSGGLYLARPGIQSALRDIEAGQADTLIVAKLDRSGRDVDVVRDIARRVSAVGGQLILCDLGVVEWNSNGKMNLTMRAVFAEWEKDQIRERTTKGRRDRASQGLQPSRSMSPFGYHVVNKNDVMAGSYPLDTLGTYQIVEEQALWVRHIFREYAAGSTLNKIASDLQQRGVGTPRAGRFWQRSTVQRILKHPVYMGRAIFGKHQWKTDESRALEGKNIYRLTIRDEQDWIYLPAPPLVDEATFAYCQRRLAEGRPLRTGNPNRLHMLSGVLRCPQCRRNMSGKWVKRTFKTKDTVTYDHFYHCRHSCGSANSARIVCHPRNYGADELEGLTRRGVQEVARHPERIQRALQIHEENMRREPAADEIKRIQKELRQVEKKEQAAIEAQIAGIMAGANASAYVTVLTGIARQGEALKARLGEMKRAAGSGVSEGDDARRLSSILADLEEALNAEEITPAERRNLLTQVIASVTPREVNGEMGVLITLKSPFVGQGGEKITQIVSMISTLARGTVTTRPSGSLASRTRTEAPESTVVSWGGRAVTVASSPK